MHNMMTAFAKKTGMVSSTLAADLAKYCELISHDELYDQAAETEFPLVLLRALCSSYRLPRKATLGKGVGPAIEANGTAAAGCSFAVGVRKLLTYTLLRTIVFRYPLVRAQNLVDDCLLQAVGVARLVGLQLPQAAPDLFLGVQQRRLNINWSKTVWMATDAGLAQVLDQQWAELGLTRHAGLRCLGGDGNDGSRRRVPEQDKRLARTSRAAAKIELLQSAGAKTCHLHRGSPCATAVWGSAVAGIADGKLNGLRVHALRSEGRLAAGTCLAFRVRTMQRAIFRGPSVVNAAEVTKAWAIGVRGGLLQQEVLSTVRADALQLLSLGRP